ncbi:chaperone DNAJ protein [Trypanosoma theileri]|uniref:Chaperone DNAJ protein n=1 Tax=Trypanosoma theileri TaxID=67003 RepID=A0A1X0NU14_9TRYP|nr:chaperone DNAJ protein [Trypanosoma theileri]ORC87590.1 chaperone DNAJ protein [Trypanosoma theileri]
MTDYEDESAREHTLLGDVDTTEKRFDPDPCGYYAALGVSQDASQKDIRQAFLHLSRTYHADKHSGESVDTVQLMNERFQKLQDAYTVLSDPKQRVAYDVGGELGISRLALIPQSINRREDIARYLELLDQEAEVLRVSKMLSTKSEISIVYSFTHLFLSRKVHSTPVQSMENENDVVNTSPNVETDTVEGEESSEVAEPTATTATATTTDGAAPTNTVNAQFSAKEVILDGRKQIVLLPSPEFQRLLYERMGKTAVSASSHDGDNNNNNNENQMMEFEKTQSIFGVLSSVKKLLTGVQADSLAFKHSFHHVFSPNAIAEFVTRANHSKNGMNMGCKGILRYSSDEITTYTTTYELSKVGGDFFLERERALNPIWTVSTGAHLFGRKGLLQKYRLSLQRKLSNTWTLKNTLDMSFTEYGSFSSYIWGVTSNNVLNRIYLHSGNGNLHLGVSREIPIVFQNDEEQNSKPNRGFIAPFAHLNLVGGLNVGFDVWYGISKYHRIGIGFSSLLSISGYSNSSSSRRIATAGINEFRLLYAQGQHSIRIPFLAFYSSGVQQVAIWISAPLLLYRTAQLLWRPYRNRRVAALYKQRRIEHRAEMDIARMRAINEQKAIEFSSMRNHMAEERVGGLVIINAKYGVLNPRYPEALQQQQQSKRNGTTNNNNHIQHLPWWRRWWTRKETGTPNIVHMNNNNSNNNTGFIRNGDIGGNNDDNNDGLRNEEEKEDDMEEDTASLLVLDVTVALQNFVHDSQLSLPGGSKSRLAGFADPDPFTAEKKELKIVYWFRHKRHVVVVNDDDPVRLPQREHLVES